MCTYRKCERSVNFRNGHVDQENVNRECKLADKFITALVDKEGKLANNLRTRLLYKEAKLAVYFRTGHVGRKGTGSCFQILIFG